MAKVIGIDLDSTEKETLDQIGQIRAGGNFQTVRKKIGSERLKSVLKALYPKYNITQIEEITGVPDSTLETWFKKLGVPLNRNHAIAISVAGGENKEWAVEIGNKVYKISSVKITPKLAYLIGFSLGDGSVQDFAVEFFNKDKKLREHVLEYLQPYGTITERERPDGLWKLRLSSKRIANLIKNRGGIRWDTIDYMFNDPCLAQKFTAAFWDAEGSVLKQNKYFHVNVYNSEKKIIDKIASFLRSESIDSTIITIDGRGREYSYNSRPVIARKLIYRLGIPKTSLNKWVALIGVHLKHSKKGEMVSIIQGGIKK